MGNKTKAHLTSSGGVSRIYKYKEELIPKETIAYHQVKEMTKEEKFNMYLGLSKGELIQILISSQEQLDMVLEAFKTEFNKEVM